MKDRKISSEKLNFIIAVCAIFISAASFYATYLQADAANKQVKAMNMPLLQFSTGNWNSELKKRQITFTLRNAGLGAAIIKNFNLIYEHEKYNSLAGYLHACCEKEFIELKKTSKLESKKVAFTSAVLKNSILAGQSNNEFVTLGFSDGSKNFWNKLNDERWKTQLELCYCSLLDDCYITRENGIAKPVEQCD